jgi:hypothetical protein
MVQGGDDGDAFFQRGGSMPPHRGAVFKQRPRHNKRLCLFRALPLVGGDASIQRGAFFAAAPWRGLQATPQAQQKVVTVSGAVVGWDNGDLLPCAA